MDCFYEFEYRERSHTAAGRLAGDAGTADLSSRRFLLPLGTLRCTTELSA